MTGRAPAGVAAAEHESIEEADEVVEASGLAQVGPAVERDGSGAVADQELVGSSLGRCGVGARRLDEVHAILTELFGGLTHGPPSAPARAVVRSWSGRGVRSVVCAVGKRDPDETEIAMVMDG